MYVRQKVNKNRTCCLNSRNNFTELQIIFTEQRKLEERIGYFSDAVTAQQIQRFQKQTKHIFNNQTESKTSAHI